MCNGGDKYLGNSLLEMMREEVSKKISVGVDFIFNFLFCIGVYLINDVVMVSGGQQRGSATHTHEPILPQTPLPSRPPHHIEQSSLCCTVGPCYYPF